MNNFEEIMSILSMTQKGLTIEKSPNSPIVTVKKKIYVPEKKFPYGSGERTGVWALKVCEQE